MPIILIKSGEHPEIYNRVKDYIIRYVSEYGSIECLDNWALELGITPWYARKCAHQAEEEGLLKLIRQQNMQGRPYRVECR